jgi:hypothetical protein
MKVLTAREEIDIGLIIILIIFTAGLGALIYLAIYYDKQENRCVHCKTICKPTPLEQTGGNISLLESPKSVEIRPVRNNYVPISQEPTKFCFNCGVGVDERNGLKFCPYCGTKLN